jgi:hypothetical protein
VLNSVTVKDKWFDIFGPLSLSINGSHVKPSLSMLHHSQCGSQSSKVSAVEEVAELKKVLQKESLLRKAAEEEVNSLKSQLAQCRRSEVCFVSL